MGDPLGQPGPVSRQTDIWPGEIGREGPWKGSIELLWARKTFYKSGRCCDKERDGQGKRYCGEGGRDCQPGDWLRSPMGGKSKASAYRC